MNNYVFKANLSALVLSTVLCSPELLLASSKSKGGIKRSGIVRSGLGFATSSSGRSILSLDLGYSIRGILFTAMTAGGATTAYYYSEYSLSTYKWSKLMDVSWGDFFIGYGLGAAYSKKGLLKTANGDSSDEDGNLTLGPAFRMEYLPFKDVDIYCAVDFVMGLGRASIGNGYGDVGRIAVGMIF